MLAVEKGRQGRGQPKRARQSSRKGKKRDPERTKRDDEDGGAQMDKIHRAVGPTP